MTGLRTEYEQRRLDFAAERLKFIDETGMNLAMTRLYGRAAPGVRVVDHVPHNYGENISLLAALGLAGLSAPMTVEGAVDAAVFRTYVEQVLGPTLRPGDIVVWDNLAVQHGRPDQSATPRRTLRRVVCAEKDMYEQNPQMVSKDGHAVLVELA